VVRDPSGGRCSDDRTGGYPADMRPLVLTIAAVALSACGCSRPAEHHFVAPVLLKRGMTLTQARQIAGPPHEVIRRPELLRLNGGHSPFSQVWVYTEPAPSTASTFVYFDRVGRVRAVQQSTGKAVSFGGIS
jgi:hypothetical protein